MARVAELAEHLRSSLWFIPALFAGGSFLAAATTLTVDRQLQPEDPAFFLFAGTAEGARSVLSTIAQSMLTFTGLVFTITMLVLQLASSQLSPRVMRTFLRDRQNQVVLGLFVATFLYTLLILRDVRSADAGTEFVPGLSIWVAFLLLVASVGAFIFYINHMAHAIRASAVIENIADETRRAIDRLYPEGLGEEPQREADSNPPTPAGSGPAYIVSAAAAGTVVGIDEETLLGVARDADVVAELVPMVGDFLPAGAPLFRLSGGPAEGSEDREALSESLLATVTLGSERTLQQDAAFGFRQLVDVGLRALSPSTNDPTTAVQALDQLHDLLRRLATREFPSQVRLDDAGRQRLVLHRPDWDDYVRLAIDELRLSGGKQLQVMRRLHVMLSDLGSASPPFRRAVLRQELEQLDEQMAENFHDLRDRRLAASRRAPGQTAS